MDPVNITYLGNNDGTVSSLDAPAGCVPVQQLHPRANGDSPTIVAAPPRTAREAMDTGKCVRHGCNGLKQKGFHECAPHRLQTQRIREGRLTRDETKALADGDTSEH
jgi:hypothetical protein